jgi:hypothetical protein
MTAFLAERHREHAFIFEIAHQMAVTRIQA